MRPRTPWPLFGTLTLLFTPSYAAAFPSLTMYSLGNNPSLKQQLRSEETDKKMKGQTTQQGRDADDMEETFGNEAVGDANIMFIGSDDLEQDEVGAQQTYLLIEDSRTQAMRILEQYRIDKGQPKAKPRKSEYEMSTVAKMHVTVMSVLKQLRDQLVLDEDVFSTMNQSLTTDNPDKYIGHFKGVLLEGVFTPENFRTAPLALATLAKALNEIPELKKFGNEILMKAGSLDISIRNQFLAVLANVDLHAGISAGGIREQSQSVNQPGGLPRIPRERKDGVTGQW